METSLFSQFTKLGQLELENVGRTLLDELLELLGRIQDLEIDDPLASLLKVISSGNNSLRNLLRQHGLSSAAFRDPEVLAKVITLPIAAELGLDADAKLRQRNMSKRVHL